MKWFQQNWFKLGLIFVLPLSVLIFTEDLRIFNKEELKPEIDSNAKSKNSAEFSVLQNPSSLSTPKDSYPINAMCTLKTSATATFKDQMLKMSAGIDENPISLTFTDLNTDAPYMIGNMGDKTSLTKFDSGNLIYLIETTSFGKMNIFTFFRDKNIMIMSKQYDLFDLPIGVLMMGDCQIGIN